MTGLVPLEGEETQCFFSGSTQRRGHVHKEEVI